MIGLTRHLSVFRVLMAHSQLLITPCLNASSVHIAVQVSCLQDLRKMGGSGRWGAGGNGKVSKEAWKSEQLNGRRTVYGKGLGTAGIRVTKLLQSETQFAGLFSLFLGRLGDNSTCDCNSVLS